MSSASEPVVVHEDVLQSIEDEPPHSDQSLPEANNSLSGKHRVHHTAHYLTLRESEKLPSSGVGSSRKIIPLTSSASTSQCPDEQTDSLHRDDPVNTGTATATIGSAAANNSRHTPRSSRSARSTFPSPLSSAPTPLVHLHQMARGDSQDFTATSNNSVNNLLRQRMEELDWYGNCLLHHAFATNEVNLLMVRSILLEAPQLAKHRNQFGRIPLHYALDRIRVNVEGIHLLIREYPEGVQEKDCEDWTPYDLAVKWKHSRKIKLLLLDREPSLDYDEYVKLRYGPLGTLAMWASSFGQRYGAFNDQQIVEDEDEDDEAFNTQALTTSVSNIDNSVYAFDNSVTPRRDGELPRSNSVSSSGPDEHES